MGSSFRGRNQVGLASQNLASALIRPGRRTSLIAQATGGRRTNMSITWVLPVLFWAHECSVMPSAIPTRSQFADRPSLPSALDPSREIFLPGRQSRDQIKRHHWAQSVCPSPGRPVRVHTVAAWLEQCRLGKVRRRYRPPRRFTFSAVCSWSRAPGRALVLDLRSRSTRELARLELREWSINRPVGEAIMPPRRTQASGRILQAD